MHDVFEQPIDSLNTDGPLLAQAQRQYREALRIHESLGRDLDVGRECNNLGLVYWAKGDLHEAEALYRRSLDIHLRLGVQARVADNYANLGSVFKARGDIEQARELWTKARELFERIGMPHEVEKTQRLLDSLPDPDAPGD